MPAVNTGSTFKASLLMALESAINNSLAYDPATQQSLHQLDGKVLHIACTVPSQSVYVLFVGNHVELWSLFESSPDTTLSGTPSAFLALWRARSKTTALTDSGITLTGDSAVLQQLQQISATLDIDWEALIAEHTGDVIAHQLGRFARGANAWLHTARREAERLMSEFLQFESNTVPSRHEVQGFCRDVDDVQLRVDRLQASIEQFRKSRKS
ncbi:MAG: SCP2 sterol-binding domain-containing protein [Cellvibrionales bacterium]|jgi:ubiquinone biosynthesis protein UbiJ|nr:SCP2 sterol-binding domain-containing protein [Cellvibrionales bacterium]